jgi:hypothetical protein
MKCLTVIADLILFDNRRLQGSFVNFLSEITEFRWGIVSGESSECHRHKKSLLRHAHHS